MKFQSSEGTDADVAYANVILEGDIWGIVEGVEIIWGNAVNWIDWSASRYGAVHMVRSGRGNI